MLGYKVTTTRSEHGGLDYAKAARLIAQQAHISEALALKLLDVARELAGHDRSVSIS